MPRSTRTRPPALLDRLLSEARQNEATVEDIANAAERSFDAIPGGFLIPIERIDTWDRQPRKSFDDDKIAELAASIAATGLLEPLVVRRNVDRPGYYIVLAGHRRLLAVRRLYGSDDPEERRKVEHVACIVREVSEDHAFADALVENLVRTDLTRREVMDAVVALQDEYKWPVREIARRTGRNASDLSVMLRVARNPELAVLVYDDLVSATTAGMMLRLSPQNRSRAVARAQTGGLKVLHVEQMLAQEHKAQEDTASAFSSRDPARPVSEVGQALTEDAAPAEVGCVISHTPGEKEHSLSDRRDDTSFVPERSPGDRVGAAEELVHVTEHTRRRHAAGREGLPLRSPSEVERLARDIVAFAQGGGRLDTGQRTMLRGAWAHMEPFLRDEEA